jgi:hypothetical protein
MNTIVSRTILFAFLCISMEMCAQEELSPIRASNAMPERLVMVERKLPSRKNIYLELAGSGGFGSINFEWIFAHRNPKMRLSLRPGISVTPIDKNNGLALIFPVMVHGIYGVNHCLDVGIGQTFTITTKGQFFFRAPLSIGYRLEPKSSRMFYRFSYTPIVSYLFDRQWEHWGGISIGYKIK